MLQTECDLEKGLEMRKWVLSGILATEETYLSHLEALLLVRTHTHTHTQYIYPHYTESAKCLGGFSVQYGQVTCSSCLLIDHSLVFL